MVLVARQKLSWSLAFPELYDFLWIHTLKIRGNLSRRKWGQSTLCDAKTKILCWRQDASLSLALLFDHNSSYVPNRPVHQRLTAATKKDWRKFWSTLSFSKKCLNNAHLFSPPPSPPQYTPPHSHMEPFVQKWVGLLSRAKQLGFLLWFSIINLLSATPRSSRAATWGEWTPMWNGVTWLWRASRW